MLLRSRRHQPAGEKPRVADIVDAEADETTLRQAQQLMEWRRSAQGVTRAWDAWLAAEPRDRGLRYRTFVAALAGEERAAAELEHRIGFARGQGVNTIDARKSGLGAP